MFFFQTFGWFVVFFGKLESDVDHGRELESDVVVLTGWFFDELFEDSIVSRRNSLCNILMMIGDHPCFQNFV